MMYIALKIVLFTFGVLNVAGSVVRLNATDYVLPDLLDAQLEELEIGMQAGRFTSLDLTRAYIQRIAEVNDVLHAVTEINPDAESIAIGLDKERAAGSVRGPLHGIPILLKNNIATVDLLNTTAGSTGLLGAKVPRDSTVVSKLRTAGAVILGKANLSQWAYFRSLHTTNGWSAHGGQTTGAYHPDQDPSGSSSGSAVASSIGLAFASLGSETAGSILDPANFNNVVGIKPTVGLTSRSFLMPISQHQDTIGPMARTVKDATYVLQAIAGKDPADNYTLDQPFDTPPDYVAAARNLSAMRGARIGVPRNLIQGWDLPDGTVLGAFDQALKTLSDAGAVILDNLNIDQALLDKFRKGGTANVVLGGDFVVQLPAYLSNLTVNPNELTDLVDVRRFTQGSKDEDFPNRDTKVWDVILNSGWDNRTPEYWAAYQTNLRVGGPEGFSGLLKNNSLDALVLPTEFASDVPSVIGSPVISVPMGSYPQTAAVNKNDRGTLVETGPGVPFGLSFMGAKWSEETLIGFAASFESITNARSKIPPYIKPKTGLADVKRENVVAARAQVAVQ